MTRASPLPPPTLEVRLAPDVLLRDGGRLLVGGTPGRLIRLSPAGATVAATWRSGGTIGGAAARRKLARRLLDAGMLLTAPSAPIEGPAFEIVIPARDRVTELRRCLASVAGHCTAAGVLIVDDGSTRPQDIAAAAGQYGAALLRHDHARGPSAARNTGLAATTAPLVAFVDSDVVVDRQCLAQLAAHFGDPAVGAAAPRVLGLDGGPSRLARYEARRSSLDMGRRPGSVGPGRAVSYVPGATLMVRREAVPGGFEEDLAIGEDVDLVWRMAATGWRVAYDPTATVRHDHRTRPIAFWRRRWTYAYSIGRLARRHPGALPAVYLEPWSAATIAVLLGGRPRTALAIVGLRIALLRRRLGLHTDQPTSLAAALIGRTLMGTVRGIAHAIRRTWSPLLLPAARRSRRARTVLLATFAFQAIDDRHRTGRAIPTAIADDLVAAMATWASCFGAKTVEPLLPRLGVPSPAQPRAQLGIEEQPQDV